MEQNTQTLIRQHTAPAHMGIVDLPFANQSHIWTHMSNVCNIDIAARTNRNKSKVYLVITIRSAGQIKRINTGLQIAASSWISATKQIKPANELERKVQKKAFQQVESLRQIFLKLHLQGRRIDPDIILDQYNLGDKANDFITYYQKKIEHRLNTGQIVYESYKAHLSVLRKLKRFKKEILFHQVNQQLILEFDSWNKKDIAKHAQKNRRTLVNDGYNTRQGNLKIIKTYLNLAVADGIRFDMPKIKVTWQVSNRESLSQSELQKALKLFVENKLQGTEQYTLGVFIFLCSTGLRISDFKQLSQKSIQSGHIVFTMKKNRSKFPKEMRIPLNGVNQPLFDYIIAHNHLLISEQKMNAKLKLIALELGIKKNISLHVARNTFATLFLENGGKITILQNLLGHQSIKTTEIYIKNTEEAKIKEMANFAKVFNLSAHQEQSF